MLCNNLKKLRNDKDISQNELSKVMNVSQQTIASWEVGRTQPDMQQLLELAHYFNVSTDYLLGNNAEKLLNIKKEAPISDEDLKFALFGKADIDDAIMEDVRRFARFAAQDEKERENK